jgi:hypothetical protein
MGVVVVIDPYPIKDQVLKKDKFEGEYNVYSSGDVDEMLSDDELSSEEAAFMRGYLS